MARNVEKDIQREKERRERLIKVGFELFSEHGIENVSLQTIAEKANVGIATLYNYYQNKTNLVVAISADIWKGVWQNYYGDSANSLNAYLQIETYLDAIIEIYTKNPNILKFSSDYKTYIQRQNADRITYTEHLDALTPFNNAFHTAYENAKTDKSIRTDIPEEELFTTITLTMLGMAERYALGIVWGSKENCDYTNELIYLKQMLLAWLKTE